MEIPKTVTLKQEKDFKIIGSRGDVLILRKTDGKAIFGLDVKIPGMLTALIAGPLFLAER